MANIVPNDTPLSPADAHITHVGRAYMQSLAEQWNKK